MTATMTTLEIRKARGVKRICQSAECQARFYDLGREQIACPVCGAAFEPPVAVAAVAPTRRRGWSPIAARPEPIKPVEVEAEADVEAAVETLEDPIVESETDDADVAIQDLDDDEEPIVVADQEDV
jgi:uncharacterized protein (TIGR02300 family)